MSLATEGFSAMMSCLLTRVVPDQKERKMISTKIPQGKGRRRENLQVTRNARVRSRPGLSPPALKLAPGQRSDDAADFELRQQRRDLRGVQAAARGERVQVAGVVTERGQQLRGCVVGR